MTTQREQHGQQTPAAQAGVRAWFDEHGWKLEPAELRAALRERGADDDTVIELLDEGADRRRAAAQQQARPAPAARRERAAANGTDPSSSVLPQNLEAEESVLGAMMMSPAAVIACREMLTDGREFYRESHALIWRAATALDDAGRPVDAITLTDMLAQTGQLEQVGGRVRLHELAALVPATGNVRHYARIVVETAQLRGLIRAGGEISRLGWERPGDTRELLDRAQQIAADAAGAYTVQEQAPPEAVDAGAFVFDEPQSVDEIRVWGDGTAIGWAGGEGLMLVGPDGVGKTTLGQQLALARAGLRGHVLGMPVQSETGSLRVLYIAADRPRQAARSMRRMLTDLERDTLTERMTVWRGPLPAMLNDDRTILARLADQFAAGTIIIDSLKDVAVDIATDEAGGRIAAAFQHTISRGIELLVMHHPRKPGVEQSRKPRELADVYGSRLIFGAFGSVVMLWGDPGDTIVDLNHLKQPVDELGPWKLIHDHPRGATQIDRGTDLVQLCLNSSTAGLTAKTAAELVYGKPDPTRNEIERTRRQLERLCTNGRLVKLGSKGNDAIYLYNGPAEALHT